jgi:long-chain acyl-CoA synthetase
MDTIPLLIQHAAERFHNRTALIQPTTGSELSSLSFDNLLNAVESFTGFLQKQALSKGDRIMIWSPSRAEWLIAYLGALRAGLVVVPLDISTKEDFLHRIADTTGARLLVTTRKQYEELQQSPVPFIDIDDLPTGEIDREALPIIEEEDLAELVFTSGTTGQPKGVMLSHRNIVSNATAAVEVVDIRSTDSILSILPLSHMFELTIEMAVLYKGACIVYARSLSPETIFKLLSSQHIACMVLVPQALQLFLNGIEREVRRQKKERQFALLKRIAAAMPFAWRRYLFGSVHKRFGGRFRFFVSGGAYLPPQLAKSWEQMGFRVLQGYGATECSPVISANAMHDHNLESVGKPLPGVEVKIAPDQEILVHGPNVALGYWHNAEASNAAFENGWYHTGDLGYLDAKQNLYIKGRKKNLIVLANGMNVYPEDVENVLHRQEHVKDAVVLALTKSGQGPEVHAILLLEQPDSSLAKSIVQKANKSLAAHQQIRGYTLWHEQDFPRTNTLKVKRQEILSVVEKMREGK